MSIESFAAIVSDNDGSAFVTKAEFEAMKKDFAEQVDNYNSSIDSKIDGAIASYLAALADKPVIETSLLQDLPFVREFSLSNGNRLGDKVEVYSGVQVEGSNVDQRWNTKNGYGNMLYVTFDTGKSAEPYKITTGTTTDRYLVIDDSQVSSGEIVGLYTMESLPYTAWFGYYCNHDRPPASAVWSQPADFTIGKGTLTDWGTRDAPCSFNVTREYSVDAIAAFINQDTKLNESILECLAGSTVPTTSLYTVHNLELNKIGNESTEWKIDKGYARLRYEGTSGKEASSGWFGDYILKTYHHYYKTTYSLAVLNVDKVASVLKRKSRYYFGNPIFTSSINGTVEFDLKLKNAGNQKSKIAIKAGEFDNVAFAQGMSLDDADFDWYVNGTHTFPDEFNADEVYKFKFDVKKDTTYFIKVLPNTNNYTTAVEIVGNIKNSQR